MFKRCLPLLAIAFVVTSTRAIALPTRLQPYQVAGTLVASPSRVDVGQPVTITVTLPIAVTAFVTGTVTYGDGSPKVTVGPGTSVLVHRYQEPGAYAIDLIGSNGALVATTIVDVNAPSAVVPIGTIYSVTPTLAPVLAGSTTTLIVTYSLASTPSAFVTNAPALYLYADLLDANGRVVRRSDPFPFIASTVMGSATQVLRVNYDVPVDAAGHYQLRAYLSTASGGAVARAGAIPFDILGGPDPEPVGVAKTRAAGSIELGPNAGMNGVNFNAGATVGLQWPCDTLALSGVFDPISGRSDPILSLSSGKAAALTSPDSTADAKATTTSCNNAKYAALAGRTQAELPYILGGGETLRGFDATDIVGPWTYQTGYGYSQLATGNGAQYGSIFDAQHAFANQGLLRFSVFNNSANGIPASSEVGEIAAPVVKHLLLDVSGDTGNQDASDARLMYSLGRTVANVEYVNAAPMVTTAGGPGAMADRDGINSTFVLPISTLNSFSFGYSDNATHSVVSRATDAFATLAVSSKSSLSSTLTYRRDTASATGADTSSNQVAFTLAQTSKIWNWNANYVLVGSTDLIDDLNDSTTRTAAIGFMRQASRHTLGLGVTSTNITGNATTATTQTSETLTYGFPFGTQPNGRGFEVQFSGANANATAFTGPNLTRSLSGLLSFHLNAHFAIGIRTELDFQNNPLPPAVARTGAIRLRLDFAQ